MMASAWISSGFTPSGVVEGCGVSRSAHGFLVEEWSSRVSQVLVQRFERYCHAGSRAGSRAGWRHPKSVWATRRR